MNSKLPSKQYLRQFVMGTLLTLCLFFTQSLMPTSVKAADDIIWNFGESSGGTNGWNNSGWECQGFWGNPFWVLDPAPGGDPWIVNDSLNVDSWDYWAVEIRMSSRADSGDRVFWKTSHENYYSSQKSVALDVNPDGTTRTIRRKLSVNRDLWIHNITGIRIDPAANGRASTCGTDSDNIYVDWVKLLYDGTFPTNPTNVNPGCTATDNVWSRCSNPNFTWSGAADPDSGVEGYYYSWSTNVNTWPTNWTTSSGYNPGPVTSGSTHYLRVRTQDHAGKISQDKYLFTLKYDGTAPTNPTSVNPGCTAENNVWGVCSNANFTWSGAADAHSGVSGYYYYWGTSSTGNPTVWTTTAGYNPGAISSGNTYYLRVKTKDNAGNVSSAKTLFALKYDGTAPTNPTSVNPGCTAENNVWGVCSNANFTWSGAADAHSGVSGYYYYWGTSSTGNPTVWTTTAGYNPGAISSGNTYYLRVKTKDNAGNVSSAKTLFALKYDGSAPTNPTSVNPGCTATDNVWGVCSDPSFTWSGASDAESGVKGYYYYWGALSVGDPTTWTTAVGYDPPTVSTDGVYYLRVKTEDNVGNISPATTLFTLKHDGTVPANPTSVDPGCDATDNVWGPYSNADFSWSGASDAQSGVSGYYFDRGESDSGVPVHWTTGTTYNPAAIPSGSTFHFRIKTVDIAGNTTLPETLFTLKNDQTAPSNPTSISPGAGCSANDGVWQNVCSDANFTWNGATDVHSGVKGYYYYWGPSSTGNPTTYISDEGYDPPALTSDETYYLRVKTEDEAGNLNASDTLFTFKYDSTAPTGTVLIDADATYATSTDVTLSIVGDDVLSGVVDMRVSNSSDFAGAVWEPFAASKSWVLDSTEGERIAYVQLRDAASNVSSTFRIRYYLIHKRRSDHSQSTATLYGHPLDKYL